MKLSLACTPIILGLLSPLLIPRCQSNRSNAVQLFLQHRCNYTTGLDRLPMFSVFVITRYQRDRVVPRRSDESAAFREIDSSPAEKFGEAFIAGNETNDWAVELLFDTRVWYSN